MRFSKGELLTALERDQFVAYYQPLVELRSGQVEAFEVLARWFSPSLGCVAPDDFIPSFDQHGIINDLTVCLLRATFIAARFVPDVITFSVNVSPTQLHDPRLPSIISKMASDSAFDLRRLTVELTESALLEDLTLAGGVAAELKTHGIKLALDDFGTGYSSLSHLQALPFDEIKVDSSFVRTMVQSRQSRKITSAVVSLGHTLGMRTVAEGIEDASQAELLIRHGCNLGQGWLYERAIPAERLKEVLSRQLHVMIPSRASSPSTIEDHGLENRPMDRGSQLRAIYDGAPVGLCFVDTELRYVSLNRRLSEMHGIPVEAHLGRKLSEVPGFPFEEVEPYLLRSLAGEAVDAVEIHASTQEFAEEDGRFDTMLVSFQPARDETSEVVGVSISVADVSAVKESEHALHVAAEALRDSEAQLRAIIEATPTGIVVAEGPTGKIVSANPRAEEIMGCSLAAGTAWSDVVRQAFDAEGFSLRPENMPLLRAVRQGESSKNVEIYHRRSDGSAKWLSFSASPYYSESGTLKGGVVVLQELDQAMPPSFSGSGLASFEATGS